MSEFPMEYDGTRLVIEKQPLSNLDELVLSFVDVLTDAYERLERLGDD